jgi:GWxTD domain-containing protein
MALRLRPRLFAAFLSVALSLLSDGSWTRAAAQTPDLGALFHKGKAEFKIAAYGSSLETFQKLDELSQTPGLEMERVRLAPVICFYRAANFAALGRQEDARMEFERYLSIFPRADLDQSAFPKTVLEAFQKARENFETRSEGNSAQAAPRDEGIRAAYARFGPAAADHGPATDERWANGPIRYLMTKSEKLEWDGIRDSAERAAFIVKFWQSRDPNPETPENEFRVEYERRIRFSDTYFTVEEKRGSETDRGLVFALFGPPTYIAQFSLTSEDDPIQVVRAEPKHRMLPADPAVPGTTTTVMAEGTPLTTQRIQGVREIWHYGRGELPRSVPFNEIDFQFLTKQGYGTAVLQRDQSILLALEAAVHRDQSR